MKELKKVYGHFDILKKNAENNMSKVTYSSLDKYSRSPYLQKITIQSQRRQLARENTPSRRAPNSPNSPTNDARSEHEEKRLPKLTTPIKFKEGDVINYFKTQLQANQNPLVRGKASIGTHSATLQVTNKANRLEPLHKPNRLTYAVKTKAGTNGKQTKTNQDIAMVDVKLPFGIKLFGVCDGHGVNGHFVSAFIKHSLLKSLNVSLKKLTTAPTIEDLKMIIKEDMHATNKELLEGEINTELSGSTVVVLVIFGEKILSFNVGDSRAIMIRQITNTAEKVEGAKQGESESSQLSFIDFKFNNRMARHEWKALPLSIDQKPDRPDERERILAFGGRIFSQKNERGEDLGPLRVWMKEVAMPGLAMTRSFGDKAGIKAGTNGQPQIMEFQLTSEDKFIIVASDGIWEYLENDEVMTLMIPFYQRTELELAAERLVKVATEIWQKVSFSRDDITVIVVAINAK